MKKSELNKNTKVRFINEPGFHIANFSLSPSLGIGFFINIPVQKWLQDGVIISTPKQKASDNFITKPLEREQRVPATLAQTCTIYCMDRGNTDQAE